MLEFHHKDMLQIKDKMITFEEYFPLFCQKWEGDATSLPHPNQMRVYPHHACMYVLSM